MALITKVKQIANSKTLADWMSEHVVLGNLAIAVLSAYSLYSLVTSAYPQLKLMRYEQVPITQRDMEAVCRNENFYRRKLKAKYRTNRQGIVPLGVEYRSEVSDIYPVFRWFCRYEIAESASSPDPNPLSGSDMSTTHYTGLSLDEYFCELYFKEKKLTKATYLDPNNPRSWVCANANLTP